MMITESGKRMPEGGCRKVEDGVRRPEIGTSHSLVGRAEVGKRRIGAGKPLLPGRNDFMKKTLFTMILLLAMAILPAFAAGDIKISLDQTEYYFQVGEEAIVPITGENTYGKNIPGTLSYSLTQTVNSGGMHFSSSNSNASTMVIPDGKNSLGLNFGTAKNPTTYNVNLSFKYNEGDDRVVEIGDIKINFVKDKSQWKPQKNSVSSSSKKLEESASSNDPFSRDPFSMSRSMMRQQMDEMDKMEQEMDKMFQSMPSASRSQMRNRQQGSVKQRLQNGQMKQDSGALKKQMEEQIAEQKKVKEEFQKNVAANPEFQKKHEELKKQGYDLDKESLNPKSADSGSFDMNYKNKAGESMNVKGEMNQGKMEKMQSMGSEEEKKLKENMEKDPQFNKMKKELEKNGFKQQETKLDKKDDKAVARTEFKNEENKKATVKTDFNKDNKVEKVAIEGEKPEELNKKPPYWIAGAIVLAGLLTWFLMKKLFPKKAQEKKEEKVEEKPFDYKEESQKMLEKAKRLYEEKEYKDAYSNVSQAMRLYLSHKNGITMEMTNDEMVKFLKQKHRTNGKVKECFDLCSMVEFAKYEANDDDFGKIVEIAGKTISN